MEGRPATRLDKVLVERSLVSSRSRGVALIEAGDVFVNGVVATDRDLLVKEGDEITLGAPELPWVSRGALKLLHALEYFPVDPKGKITLDVGASTGGFTEVLLSLGATKVYALDVGHGQLDPKVAEDPRVINLEGLHINNVSLALFDPTPTLIVVDVSFISLTKILAKLKELSPVGGDVILLLKPQFEVGREAIGKGIVKDARLHTEAITGVQNFAKALGFTVSPAIPSPILGGDGNKEFLLHLVRRK